MGNTTNTKIFRTNLNIKKEIYNYKLYKKSRTCKCTNKTNKTYKTTNGKK